MTRWNQFDPFTLQQTVASLAFSDGNPSFINPRSQSRYNLVRAHHQVSKVIIMLTGRSQAVLRYLPRCNTSYRRPTIFCSNFEQSYLLRSFFFLIPHCNCLSFFPIMYLLSSFASRETVTCTSISADSGYPICVRSSAESRFVKRERT